MGKTRPALAGVIELRFADSGEAHKQLLGLAAAEDNAPGPGQF
jgi:hypothetical protein